MKLIKEILVGTFVFFFLLFLNVFLFSNAFGNIFLEIILVFIIILELFLFYRLIYKVFFNPSKNILFKKSYERKIKITPINKEFKELYYNVEENYGQELEKIRKKLMIIYIVTMVLTVFVLVLFPLISDGHSSSRHNSEGAIFFVPVAIGIYFYNKNNKIYKKIFKENVITNFVYNINPNLEYNPDGTEEMIDLYAKAKFEDKYFNSYNVDDYISGYAKNDVYIRLCDMSLEVVDEKEKVLRIVRQGLFAYTVLSSNIPEEVKISKNEIKLKDKGNIELDNQEFEKYFDVYCKLQMVAYQVLTHDVMEVLIDFYKKFAIDFEIIIRNKSIYMRLNTGEMFEPKIFRKSTNIQVLWMYYNIIDFSTNLTVAINKVLKGTEI